MIEISPIVQKFYEFGWSIDNWQAIPPTGSVLIVCEHPPFPGLFPFLHSLKKIRPDMVFMADAAMSGLLKGFMQIPTIEVNAKYNVSWAKDIGERKKMQAVRRVGEVIGVYKNDGSQGPEQVMNRAFDELKAQRMLAMAPVGQNSRDARWKSGFGYLVKQAVAQDVDMGIVFVQIDRENGYKPTVLQVLRSNRLDQYALHVDPSLSSHRVSQMFQRHFEKLKANSL